MNSKCHLSKKISSYLDNQLSQKERIDVEKHIQNCEACAKELAQLKIVSEKLKVWQPAELDTRFDKVVWDKIVRWELERGQVKMKKKTLAILIPSGALAGILVLAFFGVLLRSGHQRIREFDKTSGPVELAEKAESRLSGDDSGYERWDEEKGRRLKDNKKMLPYISSRYSGVAKTKTATFVSGMSPEVLHYDGHKRVAEDSLTEAEETYYGGEGPVIVIQPVIPATGEGDKIIRTGFIKVEVENGKEAYNKALGICNELGGYMAGSNFYKTQEGKEAGTITMRIPKDKFTTVLDKLSTLGKVENINTDSQDVSQEYANLKSQLDAAMVVYNKMLEALQKRNVTIPEAVRLESELTPVLKRVEDLKNKIEYLNKSVVYTTVNFEFYESAVSFKTLKESRRFIQESMIASAIKAVKFIAIAIPALIAAVVLIGIATVVGLAVKQWIKQLLNRG